MAAIRSTNRTFNDMLVTSTESRRFIDDRIIEVGTLSLAPTPLTLLIDESFMASVLSYFRSILSTPGGTESNWVIEW